MFGFSLPAEQPVEGMELSESAVAKESNQHSEQSNEEGLKKGKKAEHNVGKDPFTVFVKNLDYKLTEMKIRDVFSEVVTRDATF